MKRFLRAFFAAVLFVLFLSGCGEAPHSEWKDLKEVSGSFTLEDAKNEGYVVMEDGDVTFGENIWKDFVKLSSKKKPSKVRVVHYYTLGDPARYEPEYYESIKDDYPVLYILELEYTGDIYRLRYYEDDKLYQKEFKYLMRYEGEAETKDAIYSSYVRYVLVDDNKVTWNDIMRGLLSSRFGDYIPHYSIYTDLNYKDGYSG